MSRRRVTCWLVLGLLAPAMANAAEPPLTLDRLMATLRSVQHVNARYIERRTMSALRTPIVTRGDLRFDAPDRLEKVSDPGPDGAGERMTIVGNQMTIDRGRAGRPVTLSLSAHPEIGVLVDSIRATLSGDGAALSRARKVSLSGTLDEWQMVLQPRDATKREMLDWIRIEGHGVRVTAIETRDRDGDTTEMSIVERLP